MSHTKMVTTAITDKTIMAPSCIASHQKAKKLVGGFASKAFRP